MKILIVGSGLIGVATAYFLRRRGFEVLVIDQASGPGLETSFANGGLLTPSMPEPWNTPGCWRVLLSSLGRSDAPLQLRWRSLPGLAGWGVRFLRNSASAKFRGATINNLRLASHSLKVMGSLRQEVPLEYDHAAVGTLRIFREPVALHRATLAADRLMAEGLCYRRLSPTEAIELEPALSPIAGELAGALHYGGDESGDAYRFCVALADVAEREGVHFRFGTQLVSLEKHKNRIVAAHSHTNSFVADRYVVAAGSHSTPLLRQVGVRIPVRPAKGYSVTFQRAQDRQSLAIPIVDDDWHAAITPLGDVIRVAGTAEFAGFDRELKPDRIRNLYSLLQKVLPEAQLDAATARPWCGLRPLSADGVPIIGATAVQNLLVNTGHGHLGWTMAAGSAQLMADLISGKTSSIDAAPYDLKRFS